MKPLSFISFALVFSTIYSLINFMENLAVITALYHSGSFRDHLLSFRKKLKCYSPAKVGPYWVKLCPRS